ncbi:hypothetical protein [Paenibacillus koleovorans]|uniref:hypothetical protein n=1 Tax=Paenibacillus koleovorans TaxID=121608 RepID=UPI000FD71AE5|nr:hypothetical protein [Paenibacillus koleovorans]
MTVPLLFGPYGSAELPWHVRDYGVNAVWFHGFNELAFAACEERGLEACVEFKTFRADFARHPELIPVGADGQPIRYGRSVQGICLSQTEHLAYIERQLTEGLERFRPKGIWLDYLTYAGWFETPEPDLQESCFCESCIEEFCGSTGIDASSPTEILIRYASEWQAHKCGKVAGLALRYAGLIRSKQPDCIVGAYMCPWTPEEFDGALGRIFAQDYALLSEAIDVFTPLIYCRKSGRTPSWGSEWLSRSTEFVPRERKVQLILDALDFPDSLKETAKATAAEGNPSWGIQLFGGAPIFQDKDQAKLFQQAVEAIRQHA